MFAVPRGAFGRRVRQVAAVGAAAVISLTVTACQPAPTTDAIPYNGSGGAGDYGWFQGGVQWQGDFADPAIVRVGSTYYAYATPTGGRYLPIMTSTDLKHWYAHPSWSTAGPPGRQGYSVAADTNIPAEIRANADSDWDKYNNNDGLVAPASWGMLDAWGGWIRRALWAPGVIQIGSTWYVYHAVKVSNEGDDPNGLGRYCITVASATSPLGPFRDASGSGPIQCQQPWEDPSGSNDPSAYVDWATNKPYLVWKAAGQVGHHPSSIKQVELGSNGKPVPGAPVTTLLSTSQPWEGDTIENPSKVTFNGWTYLFYSGNSFLSNAYNLSPYATGYAICYFGPTYPCVPAPNPLIASFGDVVQGPGGSYGFVTADNQLRVAYSYYWAGEARSSKPRRLAIGQIAQNPSTGELTFVGNV